MLIGVAVVGQALSAPQRRARQAATAQHGVDSAPHRPERNRRIPQLSLGPYGSLYGLLRLSRFPRRHPAKAPALSWLLLFVLAGLVLLVGPARRGLSWGTLGQRVLGGYLLGGAVLVSGVNLHRRWSGRSGNAEVERSASPAELPDPRSLRDPIRDGG